MLGFNEYLTKRNAVTLFQDLVDISFFFIFLLFLSIVVSAWRGVGRMETFRELIPYCFVMLVQDPFFLRHWSTFTMTVGKG